MKKAENPWSEMIASVPNWIKNKYTIASIIFAFWFFFVGANCFIARVKINSEISRLESKKVFYQNEIKELRTYLDKLQNDKVVQEKVAREKYFVKKPNEEVFIMNDISER